MIPTELISVPLIAALNHLLKEEKWARDKLRPYTGHVVQLVFPLSSLTLAINSVGLFCQPNHADKRSTTPLQSGHHGLFETERTIATTYLSEGASSTASPSFTHDSNTRANTGAPLNANVKLTIPLAATSAFVRGGKTAALKLVRIEGDVEFATTLAYLAEHLQWEVEEDLAKIVGAAPAHLFIKHAQQTIAHIKQSGKTALENCVEYAVYEAPTLVDSLTQQTFSAQIITLRDDLARLEKRIDRLKQR